jgi:hypothetical protein
MPYVAHVEENTILSMPAACAARCNAIVPVTLFQVGAGISDRLANLNRCSKMYDRLGFVFAEHFVESAAIPDVASLKRTPSDKFGMSI